jgi:4-hydroxyphenylpyruvate dioxygenase
MTDVLTDAVLTNEEKLAHLDAEQLRQLIGLVEYDASADPFPVTGWDAVVWVVGNATQTALHYRTTYGMRLVAYAGPETGQRDHKAYVLTSGSCRFVITGGVAPDSRLLDHHRTHGDGHSHRHLRARREPVVRSRQRPLPRRAADPAARGGRCGH